MPTDVDTKKPAPVVPTSDTGGDDQSPERVTVTLSGLSVRALALIIGAASAGLTKTDGINKALQFYAEIKKVIANGGAVYIREAGSSEMERVRIF